MTAQSCYARAICYALAGGFSGMGLHRVDGWGLLIGFVISCAFWYAAYHFLSKGERLEKPPQVTTTLNVDGAALERLLQQYKRKRGGLS